MKQILTADIGNTDIALALMEEGRLLFLERIPSKKDWTPEELSLMLETIFKKHGCPREALHGGILSSVVPSKNELLRHAFRRFSGREMQFCQAELPLKEYHSPPGMDRKVDLIAAQALYGTPAAVFDLGTCTTLSVTDREGRFLGGMICAGIQLSLNAEAERAEQLPSFQAEAPVRLIGTDTRSCMLNGAVIGTAAMLDGLILRLREELSKELEGRALPAVLTGGAAPLVLPWLKEKICYEPCLMQKGLELLYWKESSLQRQDIS